MGKTLVTGATGFVGAHVARRLLAVGCEVCALIRPGSTRALLSDAPIEWREGDLRDADSLARATAGCTTLIHCAADYRLWSRRPQDLYESNVDGTRNLLQAARAAGVERTVYTSTVGALGIPEGSGAGDEETPVSLDKMIGHYKRSKFLAEEVAQKAAASGMDIVIVNPSTPVGPGDVKPTPTGKMILDFLDGRMPAYLDTGLNIVAVEDVAEGHRLALEKGQSGRRYILGGWNLTLHSILQTLAELTGLDAPRWPVPYAAAYAAGFASTLFAGLTGRPPGIALESVRMAHKHMFFKSERAVKELGMPQTPASEALERAARWFVENNYLKNRARMDRIREHLSNSRV